MVLSLFISALRQPSRIQRHLQYHIEEYEVGTLAVDGWAVTFGTARRELGGTAHQRPVGYRSSYTWSSCRTAPFSITLIDPKPRFQGQAIDAEYLRNGYR